MQLFGIDHLPGDSSSITDRPSIAFSSSCRAPAPRFVLHRFNQDLADVVLVAVEQPADAERGIGAKLGDHLAGQLRMGLRLGGLLTQPGDDRMRLYPKTSNE